MKSTFIIVLCFTVICSISLFGFYSGRASVQLPDVLPSNSPGLVVRQPLRFDLSPPLSSIASQVHKNQKNTPALRPRLLPFETARKPDFDPVLQADLITGLMPMPQFNFEGIKNIENGSWQAIPPDTNGDIGLTHYVQWVNLSMAVWEIDRQAGIATRVFGPIPGNALWDGFGGACENFNDGDPIVLYDHLADRWFGSQFAQPNYPSGPYYQCVAISQTGDPTGAWYRYEYLYSHTKFNDYPKFGVWTDGYYMSANQFQYQSGGGFSWAGVGVGVLERDQMLVGGPARLLLSLSQVSLEYSSLLPADLDGAVPPVDAPAYFAAIDDNGAPDAMSIWEAHVDWDAGSFSFGVSGQPNQILTTAAYSTLCDQTRNCIPQPLVESNQYLDAIGDRLMHRLQFRNFGVYQAMVANHTVDAGAGRAGVRWYELHKQNTSNWAIYQQGTYAPADGIHRWMGSVALDRDANLAIGYSASSTSSFPSIRYAGRLASDPTNNLSQGEQILFEGLGSQISTGTNARWGDYSMLAVDPVDDCTFWYTNEYYPVTDQTRWNTRIGSFVFPTCLEQARGNLSGTITDAESGKPLGGVLVQAGIRSALSGQDGNYIIPDLNAGFYTVTAELSDYWPASIPDMLILAGETTDLDFVLNPVRTYFFPVIQK